MTLRSAITGAGPIGLLLLLCAGGALATPLTARAAGPAATTISVSLPPTATIGDEVSVTATLSSNGAPVGSRLLELLVDGKSLRTASVDANGSATIPIRKGELVFAHSASVTVRFRGAPSLDSSAQSVPLEVRPARLTIHTVPVVDGIVIRVGAARVTTSNSGVAVFTIPKLGAYAISPDIAAMNKPAMRADFVRWGDNVYTADREAIIEGNTNLELGLHTAFRGSFRFVNEAGAVVDPARIQSVTLTSTSGSELVLRQYSGVWLEAGTAVKRLEALAESPRTWRVLDVQMAGTNVVNRGQQHLDPTPDAVWTVGLLLYDLHVEGHDAIFGNSLAGTLELIYPDKSSRVVTLSGPHAAADFLQLPRGDYTLRLSHAGLGAPTPVVLSQDQDSVIRVITYLDIGLFATATLATVAGLLWIGRREQVLQATQRFRLVLRNGGGETRGRAHAVRLAASRGFRRFSGQLSPAARATRHRLGGWWGALRSEVATAGAAIAHDGSQIGRRVRAALTRNGRYGADRWLGSRGSTAAATGSIGPSLWRRDYAPPSQSGASSAAEKPPARFAAAVPPSPGDETTGSTTERAAAFVAPTSRLLSAELRVSSANLAYTAASPRTSAQVGATKASSPVGGKKAATKKGASTTPRVSKARPPARGARKASGASPTTTASVTRMSAKPRASAAKPRASAAKPRASAAKPRASAASRSTMTRAFTTPRGSTAKTRAGTSRKPSSGSTKTGKARTSRPSPAKVRTSSTSRKATGPLTMIGRLIPPPVQSPSLQSPPMQTPTQPGVQPDISEAQNGSAPTWAETMANTFEHAVAGTEQAYRRPREASQPDASTCPHCGRTVTAGAMYCRSCGGLVRTPGRP